jgi:hypothetical protein
VRSASDADWILPAGIILAAEYCFALIISNAISYPPRPPLQAYLILAFALAAVAAVARILFVIGCMYFEREPQPARRLTEFAKSHWRAWLFFFGGFMLFAAQTGALTWLKSMLPFAVPFWADPMLANADRAVLGTDAWRLFHPLLNPIDPIIDWGYLTWFPLKTCVLFLALSQASSFNKSRALLAYFLTMGLCVFGQYAFSSAGPIFYARVGLGDHFADFPVSSAARAAADYLWSARQSMESPVGAGISAMPSVHVATSVWIAFACSALLPRFCGILAFAFATLVFVGSMYLGWHYFVDSASAVVIAATAWAAAGIYLRRDAWAFVPELRTMAILRMARIRS